MNDQLKPPGQILLSEKQIQNRIQELGQKITDDYENKVPLLIGVLKGAFIYMADLARAISLPVEFDFMAVSSYGNATKTSGVVRIVKDLDIDLSDQRQVARLHGRGTACCATSAVPAGADRACKTGRAPRGHHPRTARRSRRPRSRPSARGCAP